jgi:hypothetical protein
MGSFGDSSNRQEASGKRQEGKPKRQKKGRGDGGTKGFGRPRRESERDERDGSVKCGCSNGFVWKSAWEGTRGRRDIGTPWGERIACRSIMGLFGNPGIARRSAKVAVDRPGSVGAQNGCGRPAAGKDSSSIVLGARSGGHGKRRKIEQSKSRNGGLAAGPVARRSTRRGGRAGDSGVNKPSRPSRIGHGLHGGHGSRRGSGTPGAKATLQGWYYCRSVR